MPKPKEKMPDRRQNTRNPKRRRRNNRNDRKDFSKEFDKEAWKPKSELGKKVKSGEIKDIDFILDNGYRILEAEIVDVLLPNINVELLLVGQSKGKFGGGSRRIFRQTQKKTKEGNKPKFATVAVIGNENGYVGVGHGKSKETVPAREKAMRNARLNIRKIKRGCGSWQCGCKEPHTIPFKVEGKCGAVILRLIPAPKGTGLKIEGECAKILKLAGIKDVWSKTLGRTCTKFNLISACVAALNQLVTMKTKEHDIETLGIVEGAIKSKEKEEEIKEFVEEIKADTQESKGESDSSPAKEIVKEEAPKEAVKKSKKE